VFGVPLSQKTPPANMDDFTLLAILIMAVLALAVVVITRYQ